MIQLETLVNNTVKLLIRARTEYGSFNTTCTIAPNVPGMLGLEIDAKTTSVLLHCTYFSTYSVGGGERRGCFTGGHWIHHLNQRALTCRTIAGTEKIMASLNTGFVSSLFTAVFFLLIFLPSCSKYTLTKGSEGRVRR